MFIINCDSTDFFEKFSAGNFALWDPEDNTSEPLDGGGIVDLPFLRSDRLFFVLA